MTRFRLVGALALAAGACAPQFRVESYPTPTALYVGAMEQFRQEQWENAVTGLEQVTLRLSPRDTLLPRAHFYLAHAHAKRGHHTLAAASCIRLFEAFPTDTLADDGLLCAADAYAESWRGYELDAEPALKALDSYALFQRLYPTSRLLPQAEAGETQMHEGLARKEFETGHYYFRRHAYDSALLYFGFAVRDYPGTAAAREALLMTLETYQRLRYRAESTETCRALRARYPQDAEVRTVCAAIVTDTTSGP